MTTDEEWTKTDLKIDSFAEFESSCFVNTEQ